MQTINNKTEETFNKFLDQVARYTVSRCYSWKWYRLLCPENMYKAIDTIPRAIYEEDYGHVLVNDYEKLLRKQYAKNEENEAENCAKRIECVLNEAGINYNKEFQQFIEDFELEGKWILFQIHNFIRFALEVMIFKAPRGCKSEEAVETYVRADTYALMRIMMSILTSKRQEIVNAIIKLNKSEAEMASLISCFFIDMANFISCTSELTEDDIIATTYNDDYDESAKERANKAYEERKRSFRLSYASLDSDAFYAKYLANNK